MTLSREQVERMRDALAGLLEWADEVNAAALEMDYWPRDEEPRWGAARAAIAAGDRS